MPDDAPQLVQARIDLLTAFREKLIKWHDLFAAWEEESLQFAHVEGTQEPSPEIAEARFALNKNLVAARQAVVEAGVYSDVSVVVAGGGRECIDPFKNMFRAVGHDSWMPDLLDMLAQAIGVYEHIESKSGLVHLGSSGPFDVETAIERALRLAFKSGPPKNEKAVQDQIEVILASAGVEFTREQETAPVGPRAFKPDFALTPMDLALEVKFTNDKHSASDAQEEISADIAAFKTKWSRLLVVVYDLGAIDDPQRMRNDNMKHFGVSVLIVKH